MAPGCQTCTRPAVDCGTHRDTSCRTTRIGSLSSTRMTSRSSCSNNISRSGVDCPLANGAGASRCSDPFPAHKSRSPCNLPRQSPGTRYGQSTRRLEERRSLDLFQVLKWSQLTHAVNGRGFIEPLAADRAELALVLRRLGPAMSHGILYNAGSYTRAGSHNRRNAALMNNEVAH